MTIRLCPTFRARLLACLAGALLALQGTGARAQAIVLGQSLPISGAGFTAANRVLQGARSAVEAVNRAGGIGGRAVELVSLDDADDPTRHTANLQALIQQHKAVALLNCIGDSACSAAAEVARRHRTALIGPISGLPALRADDSGFVFPIRPDTRHEADTLVRQLRALGISKIVVLVDATASEARTTMLADTLRAQGVAPSVISSSRNGLAAAMGRAQDAQALLVDLSFDATDALGRLPEAELQKAPSLLASLASPGLTTLFKLFHGRIIGFTSVVPNPEIPTLTLVRNLTRDSEYVGTAALSFEGLEAYVNTLVVLEAIRRAGPAVNAKTVAEAVPKLGRLDLGGFPLNFGRAGQGGSDKVEVGLRARDGRLLK